MIKSMTGFGRGVVNHKGMTITAEIKSLNHRYLDIFTRLPRGFNSIDLEVKRHLKEEINRGRIEVSIDIVSSEEKTPAIEIDFNSVRQYYKCLSDLRERLGIEENITLRDLLSMGDILRTIEGPSEEEFWPYIKEAMDCAIAQLHAMRKEEGLQISQDIRNRVRFIEEHLQLIAGRIPLSIQEYKSSLQERIKEIFQIEMPNERLEQELILHAERSDVTEERVRMESHLVQMNALFNEDVPVGRKMDFIIQELFREINTLGSKSFDVKISEGVVEIKSQLDKIREQVQNIE